MFETMLKLHGDSPRLRPTRPATITVAVEDGKLAVATFKLTPVAGAVTVTVTGKGRELSSDDITHYQHVVVAIKETIRLMAEVDKAIPNWPIE